MKSGNYVSLMQYVAIFVNLINFNGMLTNKTAENTKICAKNDNKTACIKRAHIKRK